MHYSKANTQAQSVTRQMVLIGNKIGLDLNKCRALKITLLNFFMLVFFHSQSLGIMPKQTPNSFYEKNKSINGFVENKGQLLGTDGMAVPFVYFQSEAPGLNIYITEKGLCYSFLEVEKEDSEREQDNNDEKEGFVKYNWRRIDMELVGASIKIENIKKENSYEPDFNYYLSHCPNGIKNIKKYRKISIKNVYRGIDWVIYEKENGDIKYDFIVYPNSDPSQIKLRYTGAGDILLDEHHNQIKIHTSFGNLSEGNLYCYEQNSGQEIPSSYNLKIASSILMNDRKTKMLSNDYSCNDISIQLSPYANEDTLVIDPQLNWATFYGGNLLDGPMAITTDISNNVFVTGYASSANFPVLNSGTYFQGSATGYGDVFILKFDNFGKMLFATFYGGSDDSEWGNSIITDRIGNVFVTGYTLSTNFPLQNAGTFFQGTKAGSEDVFILKFDNLGNRLWATYYGGLKKDEAFSITVDNNDNIFITGRTNSQGGVPYDLPVLNSGTFFQGTNADTNGNYDAFILKFDNLGNRLWATYYGGNYNDCGFSLTTDNNGNLFVTGFTNASDFPVQNAGTYFLGGKVGGTVSDDAFILKFDNSGNRLWATYYGGSAGSDVAYSIATDKSGNVYVTGKTDSGNLPVQNAGTFFKGTFSGVTDAFILKFDNSGNRLWATFIGGTGFEELFFLYSTSRNIVVDAAQNVYVSFTTSSADFPTKASCDAGGYNDSSFNGGNDISIVLFDKNGNLLWSTFLGGNKNELRGSLALDKNNNLFIAGEWTEQYTSGLISSSYPITNPGGGAYCDSTFNGPSGSDDGYIAKFLNATCVSNTLGANITSTQPLCSGQCNATATATPLGGVSPYSYMWSTLPSQTAQTAFGLCPGKYLVTITDSASDTATATVIITQPAAISIGSPIISDAKCGLGNGSAVISASGGTGAYTYNWSNGFVGATNNILLANTYTVTVKDANSCTTSTTVQINNISGPAISSITSTNLTCNGQGAGSASVTVISGTVNYTYSWSNGIATITSSTTQSINGLPSGIYTVTITDTNGCSAVSTTTITEPTALSFGTPIIANATCNASNGSVIVSAIGGSGSLSYIWSNSATGQTVSALSAGTYIVTVTDGNFCVKTTSIVINNVGIVAITVKNKNDVNCNGANTGAAIISTSGGTSPFTYTWSNGVSGLTNNNIMAGTYTVTVADVSGCTTTLSIVITEPTILNSNIIPMGTTCGNSNGSAVVTATGGAGGYVYQWNTGSSTQTISLLNAGTYTVTITDANSCKIISTTTILGSIPLTLVVNKTDITCSYDATGIISVQPSGIIPYTYLWSSGATGQTISNLQAGNYFVTVNDANGCTATSTAIISATGVTPAADFVYSPSSAGLNDPVTFNDKSVNANSLLWYFNDPLSGINNSSTLINPVHSFQGPGSICVLLIAKSINSCVDTTEKCISIIENCTIFDSIPNVFTPNNDNKNETFKFSGNGISQLSIQIFDRWGIIVFSKMSPSTYWDGRTIGGQPAPEGTYYYILNATCIDGRKKEGHGFVQLLR